MEEGEFAETREDLRGIEQEYKDLESQGLTEDEGGDF